MDIMLQVHYLLVPLSSERPVQFFKPHHLRGSGGRTSQSYSEFFFSLLEAVRSQDHLSPDARFEDTRLLVPRN